MRSASRWVDNLRRDAFGRSRFGRSGGTDPASAHSDWLVSSHSKQIQSPAGASLALSADGTIVTPQAGQIGGRSSSTPAVSPELVRPAARAHHKLDVEDFATSTEFLSTYELGERLLGLDSDLPGRNRDHRQRRLDERGGRRIRLAGDLQICGDVDPSRLRLV